MADFPPAKIFGDSITAAGLIRRANLPTVASRVPTHQCGATLTRSSERAVSDFDTWSVPNRWCGTGGTAGTPPYTRVTPGGFRESCCTGGAEEK